MAGEDTPKVSWRLLEYIRAPGAWQMAADLYFYRTIAQHPQPIIVRFYSFIPPAITIGHHQSVGRAVNRQTCIDAGIDIVRRPTGGRALLHRNELNYAVIADTARASIFGSGLAEAFRRISLAVAGGLKRLGLQVEVSNRRRGNQGRLSAPGAGLCVASTTRYEITCNAQKIAAAAQLRSAGKLLQHGMIYIDERDPTPPELFVQGRPVDGPGMADLRAVMGQSPGNGRILQAFQDGFADVFGSDYCRESCRPIERREIARLISDANKPTAPVNDF